MITEIIVALISGGLALVGVLISNKNTTNKIQNQLVTQQAVIDTKIDELTREVREHNNFAQRVPLCENEIRHIEDDIRHLKKFHE